MPDASITYRTGIFAEWVDYNDHLRDAFYLLVFSYATDGLMAEIGLNEPGRAATGHTLYTLECHLNFLEEVKRGAEVEVSTRLLGCDAKRLHIHHGLHRQGEDRLLAASEQMLINIDRHIGRSTPFAASVAERVAALAESQCGMPWPPHVGRVIALP